MLEKPHGEEVEFDEVKGAPEDWIYTYGEEYEKLTVAQLKDILRERGLPVSGKKAELIDRLVGDDGEEFVEERFSSWTPELVTRIIEFYGLEGEFSRVYGVLKRHYIEEIEGEQERLTVLPPKKRGK